MSFKQDSFSKVESFIYEQLEHPDQSTSIRQYKITNKLGKGGFAQVYRIVRISDQQQLAVKIIKKQKGGTKYSQYKILNEVGLMKKFTHPNIVQYMNHFQDEKDFNILLELCENGSYQQMLKKRETLTEPQVRYYLKQFVNILKQLKNKFVIHRDIKPANFLIDAKMNIKLGDFGLATLVDAQFLSSKRHTCGTPNYIAPQILHKKNYMYQIDTWAIGVLIYSSLYGRAPFETKQKKVQRTYQKIKMCQYGFPQSKEISSQAKDLIKGILVADVHRRLTPDQIMNHPFLTNYLIPQTLSSQFLGKPPSKEFIQLYSKKKHNNILSPRPLPFNESIQSCSKGQKSLKQTSEQQKTAVKKYKPKYRITSSPNDYILKSQSFKTEITEVQSDKKTAAFEQNPRTQKRIVQDSLKIGLKQITQSALSTFRKKLCQNKKNNSTQTKVQKITQNCQKKKIITEPKISNMSRVDLPNYKRRQNQISLISRNKKVIDWIKSKQRSGVAYLLENGFCGMIFNDKTRIVANWQFSDCIYQQLDIQICLKVAGQIQSINGSVQQVDKVYKKMDILACFFQRFKSKDTINSYSTLKIEQNAVKNQNFITKIYQNKSLTIFINKNNMVQCIFSDGSQICIYKNAMRLQYYSFQKQRRVSQIPFSKDFAKERVFVKKMKQICHLLRSQKQIWKVLQIAKHVNKRQEVKRNIKGSIDQKQNDREIVQSKICQNRQKQTSVDETKWGYEQIFNI